MRKALLGTSALTAGGLLAGAAWAADAGPAPGPPEPAQEGFTLTVSGDATTGFAVKDTEECGPAGGTNFFTAGEVAGAAGDVNPFEDQWTDNVAGTFANGGCVTGDLDLTTADEEGFVSHDDLGTSVFWDSEIWFTAEQTLANGLAVTARVELDSVASADESIDETWISFDGRFGELRIGSDDNVVDHLFVSPPGAGGVVATVDDPDVGLFNEDNTTDEVVTDPLGDANKIIYFTPRYGGLQIGVSFAPDARFNGSEDSDDRNHVLDSDDAWVNEIALGANYSVEYGDYTFDIGGGWDHAEAESRNDTFEECVITAAGNAETAAEAFGALTGDFECGDFDLWAVGGEIGVAATTIGAFYTTVDYDAGFERSGWGVEGVVSDGDWNYGIGYGRYEDDHLLGGFTDTRDMWVGGIGNDLAPGVEAGLFLLYGNENPAWREALGLGDVEAWAGGFATSLEF